MTTTLAESGLSAANPRKVKRLHLLIVGAPGHWKTVIAHSMPRTRTIDYDDGMQSVEWAIKAGKLGKGMDEIVFETIVRDKTETKKVGDKKIETTVEMMHRATDQVDEWIEEEDIPPEEWEDYCISKHGFVYPQFWDTLIIDSASFMTDASINLALIENDKHGLSKTLKDQQAKDTMITPLRKQDWGAASSIFMNAVKQWKGLGKNLIITAHEYEKSTEEGTVIAYQPAVIGQLRSKLPGAFDEVWYTKPRGAGSTYRINFITGGDAKREAKTRLGCLDQQEEADFDAIKEKVAKFYGVKPEQLWTPYHGSEGRKKAEQEAEGEAVTI